MPTHEPTQSENVTDALESVYVEWAPRVYELAYRMTGDAHAAEDITQETFLRAVRGIDNFRGDCELSTWVFAIAKNQCYAHLRERRRGSFRALESLIETQAEAGPRSEETNWELSMLVAQVRDGCLTGLLRCLTYNQRMAFVLHVIIRLPVKEVAEILDKSPGATRVLVHRARTSLKSFLCHNCSAYDPSNPCHCENLVGFSLRQGWIHHPQTEDRSMTPDQVVGQIYGIRDVVDLYTDLTAPEMPSGLVAEVRRHIRSDPVGIFADERT